MAIKKIIGEVAFKPPINSVINMYNEIKTIPKDFTESKTKFYKKLTISKLKEKLKQSGFKGYTRLNREELIERNIEEEWKMELIMREKNLLGELKVRNLSIETFKNYLYEYLNIQKLKKEVGFLFGKDSFKLFLEKQINGEMSDNGYEQIIKKILPEIKREKLGGRNWHWDYFPRDMIGLRKRVGNLEIGDTEDTSPNVIYLEGD